MAGEVEDRGFPEADRRDDRWAGCQGIRLAGCQSTRLAGCQSTRLAGCLSTRLGCQSTHLADCRREDSTRSAPNSADRGEIRAQDSLNRYQKTNCLGSGEVIPVLDALAPGPGEVIPAETLNRSRGIVAGCLGPSRVRIARWSPDRGFPSRWARPLRQVVQRERSRVSSGWEEFLRRPGRQRQCCSTLPRLRCPWGRGVSRS